jgi:hypothetical protein
MIQSKLFISILMIIVDFEYSLHAIITKQSLLMAKLLKYRGFLKPVLRMSTLVSMIFSSLLSTVYSQENCPLMNQNELGNFIASPNSSATTLWFNVHVKLSSNQLTTNGDYLLFSGGTTTFKGINTSFGSSVALHKGELISASTAGSPSTSFNSSTNTWITRVPPGYNSPDIFLSGAAITSATGYTLSGGSNTTTLTGNLSSNKLSSYTWFYGLACYQPTFNNSNTGTVNVESNNPVTGFPAATPTGMTGGLISGGGGRGGSNYAGSTGSNFNFAPCINPLPTAFAGPDQQVALGTTSVTLSGSGTGAGITFGWTQLSGNNSTITSPSSASTTITWLSGGIYVFQLTFTDNTGITARSNITVMEETVLTIQGTITNLTATTNDNGVNIPRSAPTLFSFLYNYISSISNNGYLLQSGDEQPGPTNDNLDGQVVSGNYFTWNGTDLTTGATEGIFTAYNKNAAVTYNYLYHVPMSIVQKGVVTTVGGVAYNIINNPQYSGVNIKGMSNSNVFNNTFYSNLPASNTTFQGLVNIYRNTDNGLNIAAHGTQIFNNKLYTVKNVSCISLGEYDDTVGLRSDYNLFYCETGTPTFKIGSGGNSVYYTFAQWQALGFDTNSEVINPNFIDFTNFAPIAPLYNGTNLGSAWQTGLAGNAVWTTTSMPPTANQGSTWKVGARVVSNGGSLPSILPGSGVVTAFNTAGISVSAYPNPYATEVNFNIIPYVSGRGSLEIYDLSWRQVALVFEGDLVAGSEKTVSYRLGPAFGQLLIYIRKIGNNITQGKLLPR